MRGTLIFFRLQTHPVHRAFVTVATEKCLGVFGCCATKLVPGGACVFCNLPTIVLTSKLSPGTRYSYAVTQSCLVNYLPAWVTGWRKCFLKWKVWKWPKTDEIFRMRTLGLLGHATLVLSLACSVAEVEGAGSSWCLQYRQQHHIIRNNILNSLSQSEHFMSCNETFWQLPPWPCDSLPRGVMT